MRLQTLKQSHMRLDQIKKMLPKEMRTVFQIYYDQKKFRPADCESEVSEMLFKNKRISIPKESLSSGDQLEDDELSNQNSSRESETSIKKQQRLSEPTRTHLRKSIQIMYLINNSVRRLIHEKMKEQEEAKLKEIKEKESKRRQSLSLGSESESGSSDSLKSEKSVEKLNIKIDKIDRMDLKSIMRISNMHIKNCLEKMATRKETALTTINSEDPD